MAGNKKRKKKAVRNVNMSNIETVLKHLYTFVSTLSKAHTHQVSQWDSKSLQNAFNWAKYAEEMHRKLKDRSFKQELDCKIKDMTIHLSPVSCFQFNFDNLEKASEILFLTLIQNPHFPENIAQGLLFVFNSQFDRFCFGLDDKSCALTTDITTLTVGGDVVKFSSKTDDELNINAQAKCLLEALANVISRLKDVAKTDQYVNTLLKRLIKFKHGISVVILVYLQAGVQEDNQSRTICDTILKFLSKNTVLFENISLNLLMEASSQDCHFADILIGWLLQKAQTFSLKYPEDELYTWICRETDEKTFDFQTLCQYFDMLLKTNKQTKKTVTSLLNKGSEESLVNIFKDISKAVCNI